MEYSFTPYEKMNGIIDIAHVNDSRDIIPYIFLSERVEVVYVIDDDRNLIGLVTPSDLDRLYYSETSKPEEIINRNYKYLENVDYDLASSFFSKYRKCHEVPVVSGGRITGKISDGIGKNPAEWGSIITVIKTRQKMEKDIRWYCEEIRRRAGKWYKTNLIIFGNLRDEEVIEKLSDSEKSELLDRKGLSNREIHDRCIREKWNDSDFFEDFEKICIKNYRGVMLPENLESKCFNIKHHNRIVPDIPVGPERRIFLFGPCNVFGAYVTDERTIEAYLQRLCTSSGFSDVEVVNCGLMGPEKCLDRIFVTEVRPDDFIIIITPGFDWVFMEFFPEAYKGCLSDVYFRFQRAGDHFLDNVRHCDGEVNLAVAERIWTDLEKLLRNDRGVKEDVLFGDSFFVSPDVVRWFDSYFENHFKDFRADGKIGAIVMNCNPFTKGHKYLIDYASKSVDHLIIFVVEEDRSFFSFRDRLEMVKRGVEGMTDVTVVPSGRYIISKETFAQYFTKESAVEVDDMDYDIYLFGKIVAKKLNISIRFVGDEPSDRVTAKYNERMISILPEFNMDVKVIERKKAGGHVISASSVRKAYIAEDWNSVSEMCPESTVKFLKQIRVTDDITISA